MSKLLYKPLGMLFGVLGGILAAAALQGAIFAVVKGALDRGGAQAFHRLTGIWPGD